MWNGYHFPRRSNRHLVFIMIKHDIVSGGHGTIYRAGKIQAPPPVTDGRAVGVKIPIFHTINRCGGIDHQGPHQGRGHDLQRIGVGVELVKERTTAGGNRSGHGRTATGCVVGAGFEIPVHVVPLPTTIHERFIGKRVLGLCRQNVGSGRDDVRLHAAVVGRPAAAVGSNLPVRISPVNGPGQIVGFPQQFHRSDGNDILGVARLANGIRYTTRTIIRSVPLVTGGKELDQMLAVCRNRIGIPNQRVPFRRHGAIKIGRITPAVVLDTRTTGITGTGLICTAEGIEILKHHQPGIRRNTGKLVGRKRRIGPRNADGGQRQCTIPQNAARHMRTMPLGIADNSIRIGEGVGGYKIFLDPGVDAHRRVGARILCKRLVVDIHTRIDHRHDDSRTIKIRMIETQRGAPDLAGPQVIHRDQCRFGFHPLDRLALHQGFQHLRRTTYPCDLEFIANGINPYAYPHFFKRRHLINTVKQHQVIFTLLHPCLAFRIE